MKSVIKSLHPEVCERIASGEQTIIVAKSAPKEVPFKGYIYQTKKRIALRKFKEDYSNNIIHNAKLLSARGKVIGEFVCNKIVELRREFCPHPELGYSLSSNCGDEWWEWDDEELETELSLEEFNACAGRKNILYAWIISKLKIYNAPKALSLFTVPCKKKVKSPKESCKGCKYIFKGITTGEFICDRALMRAPNSWQYVE